VVYEVALNLKIVLSLVVFIAVRILRLEKLGNLFVHLFDVLGDAVSLLLDISLSLFHNFHLLAKFFDRLLFHINLSLDPLKLGPDGLLLTYELCCLGFNFRESDSLGETCRKLLDLLNDFVFLSG
jgi:hypothetical protein